MVRLLSFFFTKKNIFSTVNAKVFSKKKIRNKSEAQCTPSSPLGKTLLYGFCYSSLKSNNHVLCLLPAHDLMREA